MNTVRIFMLGVCGCTTMAVAQSITIAGSETVRPIAERWSQLYKRHDAGVELKVVGGGSSTGFTALQSQQAEIAQSSRRVNPAERKRLESASGNRLREIPIATDAVVFYVHPSNPVTALTQGQLQDVLSGSVRNWRALGGPDLAITVHGQDRNSGTRQFVKEILMQDRDFAAGNREYADYPAALSRLAEDKGGIAYAGIGFVGKWKGVAVRRDRARIEPTADNIRSKRYPITRQLYLYALESSGPAVERFLRWVKSSEGQIAVEAAGFLPLTSSERAD